MMTEEGGGGESNAISSQEKMNTDNDDVSNKRVREYGEKSKGPFIVCIRSITKPLQSMKITKFLHNTYKSNLITRQINEFKMNVIFSSKIDDHDNNNNARIEANHFPTSAWNKTCRIYIPEILVETIGCISWSSEQNIDEIVSIGQGKFRNISMPSVKVLHAARFEKVIDKAGEKQRREPTNTVRVTFDGLILPEFLNVDGLLIPVREFKRKQMFCDLCMRYNHTKSHCNNKPYKPEANENKCVHCKVDDHQTGDKNCPRRKILEKRDNGKIKETRKKTYAEMLKELDPNASMNNTSDRHFTLNLGTKSERKRQQQQPGTSKNVNKENTLKKRRVENSSSDDFSWADDVEFNQPLGFKNTKDIDDDDMSLTSDITKMIKTFIVDLNLPPLIANLIIKFAIPFIDKIVNQLTTSFMAKMSQFGNE